MGKVRDTVEPGGPGSWRFDEGVAAAFDDMLERSIPGYEEMRELVSRIALREHYRVGGPPEDPRPILDLGTSRGETISRIREEVVRRRLPMPPAVGLEISPPMIEAARERFRGVRCVRIEEVDLREGYASIESPLFSVTLAVLTLSFVPINYRQRILRDAYRRTVPGGAFLLVEKVLGEGASIDELLVELHLEDKEVAGYSPEAIDRKRLALEGVLVPVSARYNEDLLRGAGFEEVDLFWRRLNFAGWLAIRRG